MLSLILFIVFVLNAIVAILTVLVRPRDIAAIWAWLLVLIVLPIVGFILYMFFGRGLTDKKKHDMQQSYLKESDNFQEFKEKNQEDYSLELLPEDQQQLAQFISAVGNMPLTRHNDVVVFTDGQEKFAALKKDIQAAKESIHIEYYAFVTDQLGTEILRLLEQKAKEGVEVRLLYDSAGSRGTYPRDFKTLRQNGGRAHVFYTSQKALLRFRLNYHVHRKIVVIDGKISYIGGFNVADQYANVTKKFGYWRDTHLRVQGPATSLLQVRFLMDWNVSVPEADKLALKEKYLFNQQDKVTGAQAMMQVVASGPNDEKEQIKLAFIKLITSAKHRLWIQTPYLVPDESIFSALKIAAASGVDVRVMIPDKPDHPFIYRATQYYARQLVKEDVSIWIYDDGFLHAKTMIVDDEVAVVGSANQDIRSYKLNFECSAVIYDAQVVKTLVQGIEADFQVSSEMTPEMIQKMSPWLSFKQVFSRLLSPIL